MKLARILLLIFSLSLPVAGVARPHYYSPRPKVAVTYCYCNSSHCPYCYPQYSYNYYCTYCHDYGCPECDKAEAKVLLFALMVAAAAWLINWDY